MNEILFFFFSVQDDVGSVTDLASIMSGDAGNSENAEGGSILRFKKK